MEIQSTATDVNNYNKTDYGELKIALSNNPLKTDESFKGDIVNIRQNEDIRSSFSNDFTVNIQKIEKIQLYKQSINTQVNALDKINNYVKTQNLDTNRQDNAIELFNDITVNYQSISNNINKLTDTEETKSRTYFDGILGSKPLTTQEIQQAIQRTKEMFRVEEKKLDDSLTQIKDQSLQYIQEQKDSLQKESTISVDFGKESSDFNSTNITNISGSIASSQTGFIHHQAVRLIS